MAKSANNTLYVVCKYDPPAIVNYETPTTENYEANTTESPTRSNEAILKHGFISILIDSLSNVFNYGKIPFKNKDNAADEQWSVLEEIVKILERELSFLLRGVANHGIQKREALLNDETLLGDSTSLSLDSDTFDNLFKGDESLHSLVKEKHDVAGSVHTDNCCPEDVDPCCEEPPPEPCPKPKCGCRRISPLEIVSRKVDMILVFVVFNNIFLIIFGVAITLGVLVNWCSGPGGTGGSPNKRR